MPVNGTIAAPSASGGVEDVRIDDTVWKELLKRAHGFDRYSVKIGVLQGKGAENAHTKDFRVRTPQMERRGQSFSAQITIAELAAIHEFGTKDGHIPQRSFIRSTFYVRRANALEKICAKLAKQVVTEGMDIKRALGILGAWGRSEVQRTFTEIDIPPPLADSTIQAKGSSKPLIDTGLLKNSITWLVVDGSAPEVGNAAE